jgi:hypothetical protein
MPERERIEFDPDEECPWDEEVQWPDCLVDAEDDDDE